MSKRSAGLDSRGLPSAVMHAQQSNRFLKAMLNKGKDWLIVRGLLCQNKKITSERRIEDGNDREEDNDIEGGNMSQKKLHCLMFSG